MIGKPIPLREKIKIIVGYLNLEAEQQIYELMGLRWYMVRVTMIATCVLALMLSINGLMTLGQKTTIEKLTGVERPEWIGPYVSEKEAVALFKVAEQERGRINDRVTYQSARMDDFDKKVAEILKILESHASSIESFMNIKNGIDWLVNLVSLVVIGLSGHLLKELFNFKMRRRLAAQPQRRRVTDEEVVGK